jgi:tetratricopeptide (TPR) repeat protein
MAEVWLARDAELDQQVVLKLLPPDAARDHVELMRRECRSARRLVHPGIVRVFDFHRDEGFSFISMAWVEGRELAELRGAPPAEIVPILVPVADALAYAHGLGVVHRDLKVSNVVLDASGQPCLLDFGIAGLLDDDEGPRLRGGGTRHSVSPQQLDGGEAAPADDLYALGVMLHELIEGHPPFWPDANEQRIRSEVPDPPRSAHPVPQRLLDLVAALLAKAPEDRPADMDAVRQELIEIEHELADATVPPRREPRRSVKLTPPPRVEPIRALSRPRPAGAEDDRPPTPRRRRFRLGYVAALLAVVALVVIGVYWFLPRLAEHREQARQMSVDEADAPPVGAESAGAPVAPDAPPSASPRRRARAEKALGRAMKLADSLEARGVTRWAADEYAGIEILLDGGDGHLTAGEYAEAERAYAEAERLLEALDARSLEALEATLADGQRALADGDAPAATTAFELAKAIQPANRTAASGLKRAAVLDELIDLLGAGAGAERQGELAQAEAIYGEAVALDPLSQTARESLARVRGRIGRDAFQEAMSRGVAALQNGAYDAAIEAFQLAGRLEPGSPDATDALAQAREGRRLETISRIHTEATELEALERWRPAADQYARALELDPTIRFAQEGRDRCVERAVLAERIEFHLTHPDRLSDDAAYAEAVELFEEASEIEPPGPKHREQIDRLDSLLETKAKRITVRLESDEKTEVTVYRIGRLGRFALRELELRPGTYTVVGTRRGYRDVRLELVVAAGRTPRPLVVRCVDKI